MIEQLIGIFGGTFDPIHNGHIETVRDVQQCCDLNQIRFIPAAIPPHRDQPHASAQDRLRMVALATADFPTFIADDRELQRDRPSYTFDTVKSLRQEFPSQSICLITGMDALLGMENWYRWQDLLNEVHFLVINRPGYAAPDKLPGWWQDRLTTDSAQLHEAQSGTIVNVRVQPNPVSATEIRYGISQNIDVSEMLAESVWQYIEAQNLYN